MWIPTVVEQLSQRTRRPGPPRLLPIHSVKSLRKTKGTQSAGACGHLLPDLTTHLVQEQEQAVHQVQPAGRGGEEIGAVKLLEMGG